MILFERFLFSRKLFNNVMHNSVHWKTPTHKHMVAVSRSTIKRDWWKTKEEEKAKFFDAEWKNKSGDTTRTGIYIGRVGIVYLTQERREGTT